MRSRRKVSSKQASGNTADGAERIASRFQIHRNGTGLDQKRRAIRIYDCCDHRARYRREPIKALRTTLLDEDVPLSTK